MDLKMGAQTRSSFGHLAPFFCARQPWEPKRLSSLSQELPRPVQASMSIDFLLIWDDFWWSSVSCGLLFIWFASFFFWLPRAFIFKFWPQVLMCWGRPQGSVRSQKSAMFAHTKTHTPTGRWMWLRRLAQQVHGDEGRWPRHGGGTAGGNWDKTEGSGS